MAGDPKNVLPYQFQPGSSPNPGGRIRNHRLTYYMNRLLREPSGRIDPQTGKLEIDPETGEPIVVAQEVAEAFVAVARDPNHPAWPFAVGEILRRTEGRVPKVVEGVIEHRRVIELVHGPAISKDIVLGIQGRGPTNGNGNGHGQPQP